MRGADSLIAMRQRGIKPALGVLVHVSEGDWDDSSREQQFHARGAHSLWLRPTDARPDLRCVVGLDCVVFGDFGIPAEQVVRIAAACRAAGAREIAGFTSNAHGRFDEQVYPEEAA